MYNRIEIQKGKKDLNEDLMNLLPNECI